jgi:site-specific DNA-methyltransferase (adenine-specific)
VCAVVIGDGTKNFAKSLTTFRLLWIGATAWGGAFSNAASTSGRATGRVWKQRFRVDHEYILIFFKGERLRVFDKEPLMVPSKHAGKMYSGTDRLTNGGFKGHHPQGG